MMEHLGCPGTQAHADCNIRPWNGGGSCLKGGYACINCTSPVSGARAPFSGNTENRRHPDRASRHRHAQGLVRGAGLLSKAATPKRLRSNAHADHIVVPPSCRQKGSR